MDVFLVVLEVIIEYNSSDKIGIGFESKPFYPIYSNNTNLDYSEELYYYIS